MSGKTVTQDDQQKASIVNGVASVVESTVRALLTHLPESLERDAVGTVIEKLKTLVDGTATPLDDAVIDPVIEHLQKSFNLR